MSDTEKKAPEPMQVVKNVGSEVYNGAAVYGLESGKCAVVTATEAARLKRDFPNGFNLVEDEAFAEAVSKVAGVGDPFDLKDVRETVKQAQKEEKTTPATPVTPPVIPTGKADESKADEANQANQADTNRQTPNNPPAP